METELQDVQDSAQHVYFEQKSGFQIAIPYLLLVVVEILYVCQSILTNRVPVPPILLAATAAPISLLFFYLFTIFAPNGTPNPKFTRKEVLTLAGAGVMYVFAIQWTIFYGISLTNVRLVGTMMMGISVFAWIFSIIYKTESITANVRKTIGYLVCFAGIGLSAFAQPLKADNIWGFMSLLANVMLFGWYLALQHDITKDGKISQRWFCFYTYLFGTPLIVLLEFFQPNPWSYKFEYLPTIVYNSVIMSANTLLYAYCNAKMKSAAITGLFLLLQPIFSGIFGALFDNMAINLIFIGGIVFMSSGMGLSVYEAVREDKDKNNKKNNDKNDAV
ncbi:hypothetical protein PCE1_001018 [Barthelona sp. PCE]